MQKPATYKQYLKANQTAQRRYIKGEQERMAEALRLNRLYQAAMASLALHPLTEQEIVDRVRQLDLMWDQVAITHGDSEAMRDFYETLEVGDSRVGQDSVAT